MNLPFTLRFALSLSFALLALVNLLPGRAQAQQTPQPQTRDARPHIVFILIDDLGYADVGFNGGEEIFTPHIDRLAHAGVILNAHYVQPICSPTRAALMTGRYPTQTGVYSVVRPRAKWGLPLEQRTLAERLQQAGYETAIVGKWHLGEFDPAYLPKVRGFDHQYGHYFGMIDNYTHLRDKMHDWYRDDVESREEGYSTHLLTREACRIIENRNQEKRLFLYVPYNAVHAPLQVPESYLEPYKNLRGPRRQLAGMLAAVDEGVGQIVDSLEKAGIREETLIVFSSDNGGPRPGKNTPLRDYKGTIYEGGIRACAFANWPNKIPAGQRRDQAMHIADWYPTLLALAGQDLNEQEDSEQNSIDGRNVWKMLTEDAPSPHDAILVARTPDRAALRIGTWKLLKNPQGKVDRGNTDAAGQNAPWELYDLANDEAETTNLVAQEPARFESMRRQLEAMLENAAPPGDSLK